MEPVIKKEVTTAIILDSRRQKENLTYPVKLRVTYKRKQKYFSVGKSYTTDEWEKVWTQERPRDSFMKKRIELLEKKSKADDLIKKMQSFTFYEFEKKFIQRNVEPDDVFSAYKERIDSLNAEGRIGTSDSYLYSKKSIQSFYKKKKLYFEDINPEFLKDYESYLLNLEKPRSKNTIGIYLRPLRALFNDAIRKGTVSRELYPFGKRKDDLYKIPSKPGIKKAITAGDIVNLWHYNVIEGSPEHRARDMFIFSFLVNGINFHDISRLKYLNIDGDRLSFIRKKTENTNEEEEKSITAILTPEAQEIINRWGNKKINENTFIFPVLSPGIDPVQEKALVKQFVKTTNKYLKRIATACGIDKKVSTYTARHSFATVLKRSNAPIAFISEALGHADQKTTQTYLDSFDDDAKRSWSEQLSKTLQS
jgi:integrase/recombinase XerD